MGSHRRLFRRFLLRELAKAFREAFRDREKAELVARGDYPFLNVRRGEVLTAPRYVNPSLERALEMGASRGGRKREG
ncbi:MAG: hypothetical protein DRO52_03605 [Candidatus Hecatellales archaeon]|nr:MAG: hypothetical protein DRO52_03605 [Candidatus Hecatellales archaeon]